MLIVPPSDSDCGVCCSEVCPQQLGTLAAFMLMAIRSAQRNKGLSRISAAGVVDSVAAVDSVGVASAVAVQAEVGKG